MAKNYILVSGIVFGIVCVAQATRAVMQVPVQVGSTEIPVLAAWVAAAVAGALCAWAFRSQN